MLGLGRCVCNAGAMILEACHVCELLIIYYLFVSFASTLFISCIASLARYTCLSLKCVLRVWSFYSSILHIWRLFSLMFICLHISIEKIKEVKSGRQKWAESVVGVVRCTLSIRIEFGWCGVVWVLSRADALFNVLKRPYSPLFKPLR